MKQKRILTMQDISCFGKSSITVALPILSAFGIETVILPTALLSTHTGGFTGYTYLDLTAEVEPILSHWKNLGLEFDGIYTGYLGSEELIDKASLLIRHFAKEDTLVFVDPVMGDRGELYIGFEDGYIEKYKELCKTAHLISPNVTEACLLTDTPYQQNAPDAYYQNLAKKLAAIGSEKAIVTGALSGSRIGCIGVDKDESFSVYSRRVEAPLHGTGDVFASALIAAMVQGLSFEQAARLAVDFVSRAIDETASDVNGSWYGLKFEPCLKDAPALLERYREAT